MAIAFDAFSGGTVNTGTSLTVAHTCTGSNLALVSSVFGDAADAVTGATYNGVAMTLVDKLFDGASSRWHYCFVILAPATGTHNIVISASPAIIIGASSASYTGVKQTGQPEAFAHSSSPSATGLTTTVTTLSDNAWTVYCCHAEGGHPGAGANSTKRGDDNFGGVGISAIMDSNGPISPAAAHAMSFTATIGPVIGIAVSLAPVTSASMSASPLMVLTNRSSLVISLTGIATAWSGATVFTVTGAGASKTSQVVTNGTTASVTIATAGQTGTITISDGTLNTTITVELALDDTNVFLSPYNWRTVNGGASGTYHVSNNPGAYFKCGFNIPASTVTPSLRINGSALTGTLPQIIYCIDGGPRARITIADGLNGLGSALSSGNHTLEVWLAALDDSADMWTTAANALVIQSLSLPGQNCTSVAPTLRTKRMIVYGDSICIARKAISSTALTGDDPTQAWWEALARALGAEVGAIGFGSQGYSLAVSGDNVPMLYNATDSLQSWNKYSAGNSRLSAGLLSPAPDFAFVNHGANDGGTVNATLTAIVAAFQTALRTACGASCKIGFIVPFNSQKDSAITAGVTTDSVTKLFDLGAEYATNFSLSSGSATQYALDGIHPLNFAHAQLAAKVMNLYDAAYASSTALSLVITDNGSGKPFLAWTANPGAAHYLVLRSATAQGAPTLVAVVAAPTVTYTDNAGSSGDFYAIVSTTG